MYIKDLQKEKNKTKKDLHNENEHTWPKWHIETLHPMIKENIHYFQVHIGHLPKMKKFWATKLHSTEDWNQSMFSDHSEIKLEFITK